MNTLDSLIERILLTVRTNAMFLRTLVLLAFVVAITLGGLEYIRRAWRESFELKALGANGAVVFHSSSDEEFRKVVFLVPASQCWINTKLLFKPGETIQFTTSGKVHLAMNQIRQEELPVIKWSKPDGEPFIVPIAGGDRSKLLICDHQQDDTHHPLVGNLVGFLQADGIDDDPGPTKPHPTGKSGNHVFHIGHEQSITNETGHSAYLWLSVNDLVLNDSDEARDAYLGTPKTYMEQMWKDEPVPVSRKDSCQQATAAWQKHTAMWDSIKQRKQWDLYFNDNIGTYLVFIEKTKERSF